MDFFETLDKRRSVRAFSDKPVDAPAAKKLLDAIMLAPSAGGLQAYKIYLVRDKSTLDALGLAANGQDCVANAPLALVFTADQKRSASKYDERGFELYSIQDATIAAAYSQLAATALGLGSVWVGGFDPLEVSRLVRAGPYEVPVAIIPIGHPAENPERVQRKPLKSIVREI
ncbi:nitroreductase family protein [Candidatus Micrarchaeota archaeon]|nr:nitroreductase family protein [Candidatus Micrarchaeota archaeon]